MDAVEDAALQSKAIAALRNGDPATARDCFQAMAIPPWLLLAQACNRLNDVEGEEAALMSQLAGDKRNLPALLAMGALKAKTEDIRAATSFYKTALAQASITSTPPALEPFLQRAKAFLDKAEQTFEAHLLDSMRRRGVPLTQPRISQAIALLTGKTTIYLQQPSMFYFPGLPQRQFYERAEFDWLRDVEAAVPAMQAELREILTNGQDFRPYVETKPGRPSPNNRLLDDPSWGAHYFWNEGTQTVDNARRAPATMAALSAAPMPFISGRSPMALWSLLKPGTHIAPHHGLLNTRLICHIPLIAPANCALRVGNETRAWETGEALIFDDSIEHEAWNRSTETRVVLLYEIWRPEVDAEERAALTTLFEAIDTFEPAA